MDGDVTGYRLAHARINRGARACVVPSHVARITGQVAHDICVRDRAAATIDGSFASIGKKRRSFKGFTSVRSWLLWGVNMKAFVRLAGLLAMSGGLHADWSDYKAVSLSAAWAQAGVLPDRSIDTYIGAPQQYKFFVKTVYTGQIRRIAEPRSDMIGNWGKAMGTPEFTSRFENEIQVSGDGLTVWLPIQESLMNEFVREAKAGAPLNVWIMYIGAAKQDRVFLVNDFEANAIPTLAQHSGSSSRTHWPLQ